MSNHSTSPPFPLSLPSLPPFLPPGGGAIEMELSKYLRDYSKTVAGKEQLIIAAVARALEVVPRQLCDNAGFDSMNILNRLRQKHSEGTVHAATCITSSGVHLGVGVCHPLFRNLSCLPPSSSSSSPSPSPPPFLPSTPLPSILVWTSHLYNSVY